MNVETRILEIPAAQAAYIQERMADAEQAELRARLLREGADVAATSALAGHGYPAGAPVRVLRVQGNALVLEVPAPDPAPPVAP